MPSAATSVQLLRLLENIDRQYGTISPIRFVLHLWLMDDHKKLQMPTLCHLFQLMLQQDWPSHFIKLKQSALIAVWMHINTYMTSSTLIRPNTLSVCLFINWIIPSESTDSVLRATNGSPFLSSSSSAILLLLYCCYDDLVCGCGLTHVLNDGYH